MNTMMDRLAIGHNLRTWVFAATTVHTNPVNDITLLGLVSQPVHFISPGGAGGAEEHRELANTPAAHPEKKPHYIGLLLPPQLLDVLVSTHLGLPDGHGQTEREMCVV